MDNQLEVRTLLTTIWDDINYEAEAVVVTNITYEPGSLSNTIYDVIDDRTKRRQLFKKSKVKGLYGDLDAIRTHRDKIMSDVNVTMLVEGLFKKDEVDMITPLDRVFLNAYYRRLLRAKLERDYIGKELVSGLVITEYANSETDAALVETLRVLRIVCKFLGIRSTTHGESFSSEKLYMPGLWSSVSAKFVKLFGESKISLIEEDDPLPIDNLEAIMMHEGQKKIRQAQVLILLNVVFNTWSGSTLVAETVCNGDIIKVVPATYIYRMLPKLR